MRELKLFSLIIYPDFVCRLYFQGKIDLPHPYSCVLEPTPSLSPSYTFVFGTPCTGLSNFRRAMSYGSL